MSDLKLVLWNMEWMNDLFLPNDDPNFPGFKGDNVSPTHHGETTVLTRRNHLSGVLNDVKPDILVVVEGPNHDDELGLFFDDAMVEGQWKTKIQYSKGQSQCVGIAVRTDTNKFDDPPFSFKDTNVMEEFDLFLVDADGDEIQEQYKFERKPLYVHIHPKNGKTFHVLGLHLKSKLVTNAYEWSKWWQMSDTNRRKILAQATQLRLRFIDKFLTNQQTKNIPLIVCGDINDGPGMDASEKRLFGSAVERLMGTIWNPTLCLRNALFDTLSNKEKEELDFSDISTTSFKDPIFNYMWHKVWIDHILYSNNQADSNWIHNAAVHHTMKDGKKIWEKFKYSSDHFPISVTVTI